MANQFDNRQFDDRERRGRQQGDERQEYRQEGYMGGDRWRGEGAGSTRGNENQATGGPYVGRGPRGYRRPDERIAEDVCERLTQHGQIDASDIDVEVHEGEVTLRGTVGDRQMKRLARDVAESVRGVEDVHNELRLAGSGRQQQQEPESADAPCGELELGMEVRGRLGRPIGEISEIHPAGFMVNRPALGNVYIPFEYCEGVDGYVTIRLSADEVNGQDWTQSPY